jgi:cephalosporin-C deacetylase-like acetyl esterase
MLRVLLSGVFVLVAALVAHAEPKLQVTPDVASGVYEIGRDATWNVSVTDKEQPLQGSVSYSVRKGGLTEIASGKAELNGGKVQITSKRDEPGTLLLSVKFKPEGAEKEITALGGAVYAPTKIVASTSVPADFDEFWKAKIAELDAVPMNVQMERVDVNDPRVEYFKITFDNIRGSRIYGQLAKPVGKSNLPALLQVQWAGVYPLNRDWVLGPARNGWLALNISAHDLPIDQPADFYQAKASKELNDYPGIGNEDRETSYFLRMFLSCRRAVDYLAQHQDWNKQSLVVQGGSQGGYQALVTAGLHPAVTALAASVPAGCDHTGKQAGRSPGWPNWAGRTWQGKNEAKMLATAPYFDAMHFATRIKCPALVGVGLVDTVCPAEGVLAACNQIQGTKTVVIMPRADHGGDHKAYYEAYGPFLERQKNVTSR